MRCDWGLVGVGSSHAVSLRSSVLLASGWMPRRVPSLRVRANPTPGHQLAVLSAAGARSSVKRMHRVAGNHRDVVTMASVMRISDLDRELAARRLRDAASTGVLGVAELEWRLDRVLSAATHGQLEAVLLDLPAARTVRPSPVRRWLHAHIATFVIVNAGLVAIWAAAGFGYFWPVWPLIGWGMAISGHAYAASYLETGEDRCQMPPT